MQQIKTLQQAIQYFSNELVCVEFISKLKWGDDGRPFCPKCGSDNVIGLRTRPVFKCREKGCKKQFSIKTGTIFESSPLSLTKLLTGLWLVTNAKNGISSCEVARSLGMSQSSAWHLLHRCREAMRTGSIGKKLSGTIEADATYVGGKEKFKHKDKKLSTPLNPFGAHGGAGKTVVLGMLERGGDVRAMVVKSEHSVPQIEAHLLRNVEEGSILSTDKHPTYSHVAIRNPSHFDHQFVDHMVEYVKGDVHTNGLENFWTLFKRSIKGTYTQCAPFHVDRYLDEQVYRYNNRKLNDWQRFEKVVSQIFDRKLPLAVLTSKLS